MNNKFSEVGYTLNITFHDMTAQSVAHHSNDGLREALLCIDPSDENAHQTQEAAVTIQSCYAKHYKQLQRVPLLRSPAQPTNKQQPRVNPSTSPGQRRNHFITKLETAATVRRNQETGFTSWVT
ncbi:hypothetical protein [uncultured Cohaesibacter sp.]|uniref:hypothetical protein n=1 Tax=uncultured Cohaesibacter sp. TaxID=1002546 RepID=UPI002930F69B|nr:hypothetical protein [uncultured Cohaesibacter sp.]